MRIEPELTVLYSHGCVHVWFHCHGVDDSCFWIATVKEWLEGVHEF